MLKYTVCWGRIEDENDNFVTFVEVDSDSFEKIMDAAFLVEWETEHWIGDYNNFEDFRHNATYDLYAVFAGHIRPEF